MKEKLVIRNFGPIKSVELDLSRFNVFIGEQGTGKSTVAKVLAVCRYFSYIFSENNSVPSDVFELGLLAWGMKEAIQPNSFVSYECEHYIFTAERKERQDIIMVPVDGTEQFNYVGFATLLSPKSDAFKELLNEFNNIKPKPKNQYDVSATIWRIPTSFFQNDVAEVMDNPFYIPTERGLQSIFSLGKNSIPNISDSLFNQFANLDQIARLFKNDTLIEPLGLVYKNVDGRGYIRKVNEDTFYSLYTAASGYQSTIPVVLLMEYYISIRKKAKTFIIEESELNLFPSAQKDLMQYLVDKTMNYGNMMLLTTHSPYVLTTLNNLLYAYKSSKIDSQVTERVIDKKYWLNPDDLSVYMMLSNGECENIMDMEEGLINAEKIDGVSSLLNGQFDQLLKIEFP